MKASICFTVRPFAMAAVSWEIISVARSHMRAAPKSLPVSAWATSFIKPRSPSRITVRPLADMRPLAVLTGMPFSLASASVTPTVAISGRV